MRYSMGVKWEDEGWKSVEGKKEPVVGGYIINEAKVVFLFNLPSFTPPCKGNRR